MDKRKLALIAERVLWTALQAGLGVLTVDALELPQWLIVPVAMGLAALKNYVGTKVGDPNSTSIMPARFES